MKNIKSFNKKKLPAKKKMTTENKAMRFSFLGSAAFVVAELISFIVTGSHTILMDCIFDGVDLILIGPFLVLIPFLYKPETERHPYGYGQYESLFLILKYGALLCVCAATLIQNIELILRGGHTVNAHDVAAFEIAVMAGCLFMYLVLYRISRKYSSQIIQSELYSWKLYIFTSSGIALAFLVQIPLEKTSLAWLTPYTDPVVAIVLTGILLIDPIRSIVKNVKELLLFSAPKEQVDYVRSIAEEELKKYGSEITFLEVIRTGRKTWIEIYVDENSDLVSVRHLANATRSIKAKLKGYFDQYYVDIIPDVGEVKADA